METFQLIFNLKTLSVYKFSKFILVLEDNYNSL